MGWTPASQPTKEQIAARRRAKRSRFLVDESLGVGVAEVLRATGYNVAFAPDVGLGGRSDEDVFAFAWSEQRILLTHDADFLDDRAFPENRNAGVAVILAGADGNQKAMVEAIRWVHGVPGKDPEAWVGTKVVINQDEVKIRRRHIDTGKITTTRYTVIKGRAHSWDGETRPNAKPTSNDRS